MRPVVISPLAAGDLVDIVRYLGSSSEQAPSLFISRFDRSVQVIARHPSAGKLRKKVARASVRIWPFWNYVIVYRAARGRVEIIRVLHGARDIWALLDADE